MCSAQRGPEVLSHIENLETKMWDFKQRKVMSRAGRDDGIQLYRNNRQQVLQYHARSGLQKHTRQHKTQAKVLGRPLFIYSSNSEQN